jgi:hypothetical protein
LFGLLLTDCAAYINGFMNGIFVDQIAREEGHPICVGNTNTTAVRDALVDFLKASTAANAPSCGLCLGGCFPAPISLQEIKLKSRQHFL